jgi:phospholipase/lecithinase/hemolysin
LLKLLLAAKNSDFFYMKNLLAKFASFFSKTVLAFTFICANMSFAAPYTSITVIGDSMLDGGNDATAKMSFYKLFGNPFPTNPGYTPVPFENYRYSDGLVSAEQMAKTLNLFTTQTFFNFSVGGLQSNDLNAQINNIFADASNKIDPTGLYVIEVGMVDLDRNSATPEQASTNIVTGIQNLYNRGARRFVVMNSFYFGYMPNYKFASASAVSNANTICQNFNNLVKSKLEALSFSNNILLFDNGKYFRDFQLNPSQYGITNTTDACVTSTQTGQYCSNRQEYLYWDTVHITGRAQQLLGTLLVDTVTYPNVSLTSPQSNITSAVNTAITLSATAKDGDGSISKVEFYNGNTLIATDTTQPYSISWTPTSSGVYAITAKAFDDENKSTTTSAISVTVTGTASNAAPVITLNNAVGSNGNSQGSITAVASDSDGTISRVEFYANGNLISTDTSSPYTLSWSGVGNGTYSLTAKAFDNANASTTSNAVSVVVNTTTNPSNAAPTVSLNAPVASNGNSQGSITAVASDSDGTINRVEFYANGNLIGSDSTAPYTFSWSNAPNGTYSLTARAFDNANASTTSSAISITIAR